LKNIQSRINNLKKKNDTDTENSPANDKYREIEDSSIYDDAESNSISQKSQNYNYHYGDTQDHDVSQSNSSDDYTRSLQKDRKSFSNYEEQRQNQSGDRETPNHKKFIDPHQYYYQFNDTGHSNQSNSKREALPRAKAAYRNQLENTAKGVGSMKREISFKKNDSSNDTLGKSATGLLRGCSEIKEETDESERDPMFNIASNSFNDTPKIVVDSTNAGYTVSGRNPMSWHDAPETVKYPESGYYPTTVKYASSQKGGAVVDPTMVNSKGDVYQNSIGKGPLGGTGNFNYTGTFSSARGGAVTNKLSDRFHKLENDINTIQDNFKKLKNKNKYSSSNIESVGAHNFMSERQNTLGDTGPHLPLGQGGPTNKSKLSARTYMSNRKYSDSNPQNSQGQLTNKKPSPQKPEHPDSHISFSNRDHINTANNDPNQDQNIKNQQSSNKSNNHEHRSLQDQETLNKNSTNKFIYSNKDFILDGEEYYDSNEPYGKSRSLRDGVLCATGDTRAYMGEGGGEGGAETMSEKIFESSNRKNGNGGRAKTENSGKSMLLKRDMIQLSDGEDD
jgi:hypothetical protein